MRTCELAAVQIELAVRDIEIPVASLGGAIGRLSSRLGQLSASTGTEPGQSLDAATLAALTRDVHDCVEGLQFVDRLAQHLMHVRDLLLCDAAESGDDATWREAIRRIRDRLSSDEQRSVFDLILDGTSRSVAVSRGGVSAGASGSIELF